MSGSFNAVADGTSMYIRNGSRVYTYTVNTSSWRQLPNSPTSDCSLVIINNLFTLIGGYIRFPTATNQLFSLTGEGSGRRWTEEFPPMPIKRHGATALCTGSSLIVAGGSPLRRVEVMNTETLQWSTAADLPQPLNYTPGAVCGDRVYILSHSKSMYTCSVSALL